MTINHQWPSISGCCDPRLEQSTAVCHISAVTRDYVFVPEKWHCHFQTH